MMNMKVVFGGFISFDRALLTHQASFVFHGGFWRLTSSPGLLSFLLPYSLISRAHLMWFGRFFTLKGTLGTLPRNFRVSVVCVQTQQVYEQTK